MISKIWRTVVYTITICGIVILLVLFAQVFSMDDKLNDLNDAIFVDNSSEDSYGNWKPPCAEHGGCIQPFVEPSNEHIELELKYSEGWNDGYKIGLADRPSDEEICGALIDYQVIRPIMFSGSPGVTGSHRVAYEAGYMKGWGFGWNEGFTECENICEELLNE